MEILKISKKEESKDPTENTSDYGSEFYQVCAHGFFLMNFVFFCFQKSPIFTQKHTSLGSLKVFCGLSCVWLIWFFFQIEMTTSRFPARFCVCFCSFLCVMFFGFLVGSLINAVGLIFRLLPQDCLISRKIPQKKLKCVEKQNFYGFVAFFCQLTVSKPVIHVSVRPVIPVELYPLEPVPEEEEPMQQIELPVRDLSELDSVLGLPLLDAVEEKQALFEKKLQREKYVQLFKVLVDLFLVELTWKLIW